MPVIWSNVHAEQQIGSCSATFGPFVPVPEVRMPDADGLVLAAGEHHVGRRAVLERVAALRDPRVAHAAAAPESDRIDDSRVHKVL